MKKSRVWQAIVPGTQNKPQDTLQIRKTPWRGVTKQPPAVPLPGQTSLLNRMKKSNCSRHTNLATRHPSNQENTLARRDETASCGQTSLLNRMKKSRVWQAIVPGTQNKPQDTLQIRKTPWHGVTKQPPAVPLPGPNVTPEPNEKSIKGLAGNCSRHTNQATRHPSNQENILWLGFCAWNSGSAGQTLDFFIRFRSDVWPGHRAAGGCFVTPCQGVFLI